MASIASKNRDRRINLRATSVQESLIQAAAVLPEVRFRAIAGASAAFDAVDEGPSGIWLAALNWRESTPTVKS